MSNQAVEITLPTGRMVFGSTTDPVTKDFDGKPLTIKNGPDAGKPTQRFDIGYAIRKTPGVTHWASEPGWGQQIWAKGFADFPGGAQSQAAHPTFSWKIVDGDSTIVGPKSKSKIPPCKKEGYPGHWVLTLSSTFPPKCYNAIGANAANPPPMDAKGIVPGYAIQAIITVKGNTGASPGVYLNHAAVALRAYLPEIMANSVSVQGKFGGALPPGASEMPTSAAIPSTPAAVGAFTVAYEAPPAVPTAAPLPSAVPATPTAVVPAPSLVGIPTGTGAPLPPGAPPAPAVKPPHKGIPYESYKAQGWTDAQLAADGYQG